MNICVNALQLRLNYFSWPITNDTFVLEGLLETDLFGMVHSIPQPAIIQQRKCGFRGTKLANPVSAIYVYSNNWTVDAFYFYGGYLTELPWGRSAL